MQFDEGPHVEDSTLQKGVRTATCDKAGQPNDVCPHGQVMSALPNDVANGCDVVPLAQWANITSLATIGSNIIMNEASNIIMSEASNIIFA